jgi:hypothetical protein
MKKFKITAARLAITVAATVLLCTPSYAQNITDIDDDLFKVSSPDPISVGRILASTWTFGIISSEKSDAAKKAETDAVWNSAMNHAIKKGCILVARPFDDSTERERRIKWETAEAKGEDKTHLVRTAQGRVFYLAHSVEASIGMYNNTFICIRDEPTHTVNPTSIARPAELLRGKQ